MKTKTAILFFLFIGITCFAQIQESKDLDNNSLLFVGKTGEDLQNQLKKDTVFKNVLKKRLLLSVKKRERTLDYITNLNDYLKSNKKQLNPNTELKIQAFFKDFFIETFKYYYCDKDCSPIFNQNVIIENEILVAGFGRKKQNCDGLRFFKRGIFLVPKQDIPIHKNIGVRFKFNEIDNYSTQKNLSDLIENIANKKADATMFWKLDSLIPKLINMPLHDVVNTKLNYSSRGGTLSIKDGEDYRFYQKKPTNKKESYGLYVWKKNDSITKITYHYPPEKQQDTISFNDLKMFINNVKGNIGFYGLQNIGEEIFNTKEQAKIIPTSYKPLLKPYYKYSTEDKDVYEFLNWHSSDKDGHGASYYVSIYVNKTNNHILFYAIGEHH